MDPPEAELFLDDQKLPSNPTSKVLPVDGKVYKLRAVRAGLHRDRLGVSPTRDDAVELALQKAAPEHALVRAAEDAGQGALDALRRQPRHLQPRPPRRWKPSKPASCAQPFCVDADGIKKARPECPLDEQPLISSRSV